MLDTAIPMRSLLVAVVDDLIGRLKPGQVIAVRLSPSEAAAVVGDELDGTGARAVYCPSNLAMRHAMARHEAEGGDEALVVLTDRDDSDLEEDLVARFVGQRLRRLDAWHAVARLFNVSPDGLDPRLRKKQWMAERLVELAPAGGYASVPSGVLSLERAYHELMRAGLGFDETRPDLVSILRWGADAKARAKFAATPEEQRRDAITWIVETATAVAEPLLSFLLSSRGADAVAFGLALDVLRHPSIEGTREQQAAIIRTEALLGGRTLEPQEIVAWADAARRVVDEQSPELRDANLSRADAILDELRATDFGARSDLLPSGLDARVRGLAAAIEAFLDAPAKGSAEVEQRLRNLDEHALSVFKNGGADAPLMAVRLVRWLARAAETPDYLGEAARHERDLGGFIALACERLSSAHGAQILLGAFDRLREAVMRRRERDALDFATRLVDAVATGTLPPGVIGVEDVLDEIVAPIAAEQPVLLLVLDGASCSQLAAMGREIEAEGFAFCRPEAGEVPVVLAALPTLTEISRASLFCGRRRRGQQKEEKEGFAGHSALAAASKKSKLPVVFHKKDLSEEGSQYLANAVRDVLADPTQRVVGLVINAVDDHLAKGDQVPVRWTLSQILHLKAVLESARDAKRVIVLTADHGHVLDRNMTKSDRQGENARWRSALGGTLDSGEFLVEGPRVLTGDGKAILMASPLKRYAGRPQNGYHGGMSPQEVVVPLAVLASSGEAPQGYREFAFAEPKFWALDDETSAPPKRQVVRTVTVPEGFLPFGAEIEEIAADVDRGPDWIEQVLASDLYRSQERQWARMAPAGDRVRRALAALASRGGKMTAPALARALDMPSSRLARFGAAMQKLLNLDGMFVIDFDVNSDSWVLDETLARRQFLD